MGLQAGFWAQGSDLGLKARFRAPRLGVGPHGWVLNFKAGFWASRLGLGPRGWNLGFKAGIWASRVGILALRLGGRWTEEEEEEENLVEFGKIRQNLAKFIKNLAKLGRIWQN